MIHGCSSLPSSGYQPEWGAFAYDAAVHLSRLSLRHNAFLVDQSPHVLQVGADFMKSAPISRCHAGATATLFLAFKRGSNVFETPDTVNSILQYLELYAQAVNIRPHFPGRKETHAFKGSCNIQLCCGGKCRAAGVLV